MTVRKIIELIDYLKNIIEVKGFKLRLTDYMVTIQNNSGNLVLLKEINDKLINDLNILIDSEIPIDLTRVLVNSTNKPFTDDGFLERTITLRDQDVADPTALYNALNLIMSELQIRITENITELDRIKAVVEPFLTKDYSVLQLEDNAIFALIFNNPNSYENLKNLSFELKRWDKGLYIYQQIISNEAPRAFEIVEIDQGSIEVVLNLHFAIADQLLELFKTGLEVYGAYLAYKTTIAEITKTYRGNTKLIKSEEEREALLLENVKKAVKDEITKQAKKAKAKNQESIEKKIDEVTKLVTDHIVKGNSVKLLSAPETQADSMKIKEDEKEKSLLHNRKNYKKIDESTKLKLLKEFTEMPNDDYEE